MFLFLILLKTIVCKFVVLRKLRTLLNVLFVGQLLTPVTEAQFSTQICFSFIFVHMITIPMHEIALIYLFSLHVQYKKWKLKVKLQGEADVMSLCH